MFWFLLGFIFGLFVAQESPRFPNIRENAERCWHFAQEMLIHDVENDNDLKSE